MTVDPRELGQVHRGVDAQERIRASSQQVIERYCHACPVTAACLTDALEHRSSGIRGGRLIRSDETSNPLGIIRTAVVG